MPIAMRALEKSTGKSAKELMKMMEMGQLSSEYIMPMVMALGELADANGAYSKALTKVGTVENRMKTSAGVAAGRIADAGFTKGLINLYETVMKAMNDNGITLDRVGKIYEKVFNGLSNVLGVAVKWIEIFVRSLESLWRVIQWGVENPIGSLLVGLTAISGLMLTFPKLMGAVGTAVMTVLRGPLAVITAVMSAIDEVRSVFDENLIGVGENDKASAEDRKITAANARVFAGRGSKEDKALISNLSAERINQAQINSGGPASFIANQGKSDALSVTNNPITRFGKKVGNSAPTTGWAAENSNILPLLIGFAKASTDVTTAAIKDMFEWQVKNSNGGRLSTGLNLTIVINGSVTEDNIQQIKEQTKKVMDDYSNLNTLGGF